MLLWILTGLTLVLTVALGWNLMEMTRIKGVCRAGLRKAEADGRNVVRIPYNQLAEAMGWSSDQFPMPDDNAFKGKPGPHPATLSPARRRKLGGGK